MPERMSGVLTPVVTPFGEDLTPDPKRLVTQCRWLLSQQVGLALFGTNSEANSLSVDEKIDLLDHLAGAGIDVSRMMPGTGACAIPDVVRLTSHAARLKCGGTLMLPPFYYKGVSDDGLFAFFSEVIQRTGEDSLQIYLYHIPPVAQVGLSLPLIERLIKAYPDTIAGIKDSSGDWSNTAAMLEREWPDFRIFVGSESFLLENMRSGGAGCISATANVNPAAIAGLYRDWQNADADARQRALNDIRQTVMNYPMIPALKAMVAEFGGDDAWRRVRPPLVELDRASSRTLAQGLREKNFAMPGLQTR